MFELINELDVPILELDEVEKIINSVVIDEKLENCHFNIIIIDNTKIREINKEYRNMDDYTDVISFALEDDTSIRYEGFRLLGDIYISLDKANEQANEYNHSLLRELCFLSIHGLLHLLGYNHESLEEEKEMFNKQDELLNKYNILR